MVFAPASIVLAGAFLAILVLLHFLKPELAPSWRMISEYEIGRLGWIMRLAFVCWGAGVLALTIAVQSSLQGRSRVPMGSLRKTALVAGLFYVITFVSIPILWLYNPVKKLNYIIGPGPDARMIFGGVLEMIVGLAGIGTAVTLYPVIKRQNRGAALGSSALGPWRPPGSSVVSPACWPWSPCGRPESEQMRR